ALGNIIDPKSGEIIAGAFHRDTEKFLSQTHEAGEHSSSKRGISNSKYGSSHSKHGSSRGKHGSSDAGDLRGFAGNTTIGVVATNAILSKEGANKVAQMAHDGLARVIRPVHTMYDGDTVFALSTGQASLTGDRAADISAIGEAAASAVEVAIIRGIKNACGLTSIPAASSISKSHSVWT
ncbi:MAG: P1 family peptidase, partial [Bacillota bacterium]